MSSEQIPTESRVFENRAPQRSGLLFVTMGIIAVASLGGIGIILQTRSQSLGVDGVLVGVGLIAIGWTVAAAFYFLAPLATDQPIRVEVSKDLLTLTYRHRSLGPSTFTLNAQRIERVEWGPGWPDGTTSVSISSIILPHRGALLLVDSVALVQELQSFVPPEKTAKFDQSR